VADTSDLKQQLRDREQTRFDIAADTLRQQAADLAPYDTGRLRGGVEIEGASYDDKITARIVSTARADDGTDYGQLQNDGLTVDRIYGNPYLSFVYKGVHVVVRSVRAFDATHWWDNSVTQDNWTTAVETAGPL
jgi:hypothetical protein